MTELQYSISELEKIIAQSPAIKMLRAKTQLPLIVSFLYQTFKAEDELTIPFQTVQNKLAAYLEAVQYKDTEGETNPESIFTDYDDRAKIYLNQWVEYNYLRNVIDEERKEPVLLLSQHTEKVFRIFELLKERSFVGTESKFMDIFHKMRDIVENANPDKQKRLEELERKKVAIEEEIAQIKVDGYVQTYEDFHIKSRYEDMLRLSNELIGDFKEVEDNFRQITRSIYEYQQQQGIS